MGEKIRGSRIHLFAFCIIVTIIWMLAAHGFMFMNPAYSHDSLDALVRDINPWETSLGRFLHNPLRMIFGQVTSTWFIGLVASLFTGMACFLICDYLKVKKTISIVLISGLLATNYTMTNSISTYMPWVDAYGISLFFAALAVWIMNRWEFGFLAGIPCVVICLGLYPPYILCVPSLFLIWFMISLNGEKNWKKHFLAAVKVLIMFAVGYLMYRLILNAVLQANSWAMADSNNSINTITIPGLRAWPMMIRETYISFFDAFTATFGPGTMNHIMCLLLLASGAAAVFCFFRKNRASWVEMVLFLILLVLSPLVFNGQRFVGINATYHPLMLYSIFLAYVGIVVIFDKAFASYPEKELRMNGNTLAEGIAGEVKEKDGNQDEDKAFLPEGKAAPFRNARLWVSLLIPITIGLVLFFNVRYSNNIYTLKYLEEKTSVSLMTRIMSAAERTEGYDPAEMPVVILGSIQNNPLAADKDPAFYPYILSSKKYLSITYSMPKFLKYYMGYSLIGTSGETMARINEVLELNPMPAYPADGFARVIDGCLVVKVSE